MLIQERQLLSFFFVSRHGPLCISETYHYRKKTLEAEVIFCSSGPQNTMKTLINEL